MNVSIKIARYTICLLMLCSLSLSIARDASASSQGYAASLGGPYSVYVPMVAAPNFSIFGTTLHQPVSSSELPLVKSAGLAWSRVVLEWKSIEPVYGVFDWSWANSAEGALLAASQNGMQSVLLLESTPNWALKSGFMCGVVAENYFSEFAAYAKEAVKKYSAPPYNVKYFEIYNEPDAANILGCWGTPSDTSFYGGAYYGQFLKAVYPTLKAANPKIQVLVGGLLMDCDPVHPPMDSKTNRPKDCTSGRFFDGILSSGAGNSFDGVSFHSYDYYTGPGSYNNLNWHSDRLVNGPSTLLKAAYLRSTMQNYGVAAKPLLNTEYALFCGSDYTTECSIYPDLEATKAYYIVEFMASAAADGYQAAIWYAIMGGRNNSLLNPDFTPLPVYQAYKATNQKIGNAAYVRRVTDLNFVIHEFKKTNGQKIWIAWTANNTAQTLTLPVLPAAIYRIGADGNAISEAAAATLSVDIAPVIIEFAP